MTTYKQLLEQALEALEDTVNGCICRNCIKQVEAITSLRQAIEQAENIEAMKQALPRFHSSQCEHIRHTKEGTHWCALAEKPAEWVGLTYGEFRDCLVEGDPCEALAEPEAWAVMREVADKLKEKNT